MPERPQIRRPEILPARVVDVESGERSGADTERALRASRIIRLLENPDVRALVPTLGKLCVNLGISLADTFGWIFGDPISWGGDATKLSRLLRHEAFKRGIDLTPAVTGQEMLRLEGIEILTCGILPSYPIMTWRQYVREDKGRLTRGMQAIREILKRENPTGSPSAEVIAAAKVFEDAQS